MLDGNKIAEILSDDAFIVNGKNFVRWTNKHWPADKFAWIHEGVKILVFLRYNDIIDIRRNFCRSCSDINDKGFYDILVKRKFDNYDSIRKEILSVVSYEPK